MTHITSSWLDQQWPIQVCNNTSLLFFLMFFLYLLLYLPHYWTKIVSVSLPFLLSLSLLDLSLRPPSFHVDCTNFHPQLLIFVNWQLCALKGWIHTTFYFSPLCPLSASVMLHCENTAVSFRLTVNICCNTLSHKVSIRGI